jgi:hypothetical protein
VIAKAPTESNVKISALTARNRAPGFLEALRLYVGVRSRNLAFQLNPQTKLGVYSWFKLVHDRLPFSPLTGRKIDLVRATPIRRNRHGVMTQAPCFDTVLIEQDYNALGLQREYLISLIKLFDQLSGMLGYCAARVLVTVRSKSFAARDSDGLKRPRMAK